MCVSIHACMSLYRCACINECMYVCGCMSLLKSCTEDTKIKKINKRKLQTEANMAEPSLILQRRCVCVTTGLHSEAALKASQPHHREAPSCACGLSVWWLHIVGTSNASLNHAIKDLSFLLV